MWAGGAENGELSVSSTLDAGVVISAAAPLQHLQMAPLEDEAEKGFVPRLREVDPKVVGGLFEHSVKIVRGALRRQGQEVEELQKLEGGTGLWSDLTSGVEPASKELDVLRSGTIATAVVERDVVNAVVVKDTHTHMGRHRGGAAPA